MNTEAEWDEISRKFDKLITKNNAIRRARNRSWWWKLRHPILTRRKRQVIRDWWMNTTRSEEPRR